MNGEQTEEILEAKDRQIAVCQHEIIYLEKENEVLKKALSNMAERYFGEINNIIFPEVKSGKHFTTFTELEDYFIQQAKEENLK